ncbi:MAG: FkbM family methyltransferase [Actinomycetota bacterium]
MDLYRKSHLAEVGWYRSYQAQRSVDARSEPLPWYTYACSAFITERLPPEARVFEYGSGGSTRWYASRVAEVIAVEHDPEWVDSEDAAAPGHARIILREDPDAYVREIANHGLFQVVVVDGLYRSRCVPFVPDALTEDGIIVWDNSDREEFREAMHMLQEKGFKELPFSGMGPVNVYGWTTSILYRDFNCLGI